MIDGAEVHALAQGIQPYKSHPNDAHVYPSLGKHRPDPHCWCRPRIIHTDPVGESW